MVASPRRLTDVLEMRRVSLAQVKYIVIDEANTILDMGFKQQITHIVKQASMPPIGKCQTMLFSTTFPREVHELTRDRRTFMEAWRALDWVCVLRRLVDHSRFLPSLLLEKSFHAHRWAVPLVWQGINLPIVGLETYYLYLIVGGVESQQHTNNFYSCTFYLSFYV